MNRMALVWLLMAGIFFVSSPVLAQAPPAADKAGCITRCDAEEDKCRQDCADQFGGLSGGRADCEADCNQKKLNCYQVCDNIGDISSRTEGYTGGPTGQPGAPKAEAKPEEKPYFESGGFEVKTQPVLTPGDMGTPVTRDHWRSILSFKTNRGARGGSGYAPKDGAWAGTPTKSQPLMGRKGLYPITEIWEIRP